jgi:hypothetical protein
MGSAIDTQTHTHMFLSVINTSHVVQVLNHAVLVQGLREQHNHIELKLRCSGHKHERTQRLNSQFRLHPNDTNSVYGCQCISITTKSQCGWPLIWTSRTGFQCLVYWCKPKPHFCSLHHVSCHFMCGFGVTAKTGWHSTSLRDRMHKRDRL